MKSPNILKSKISNFILICLCGLLSSGCFVSDAKGKVAAQNINKQGPTMPLPPSPLPVAPKKIPSIPVYPPPAPPPNINSHTNTADLPRPDERPDERPASWNDSNKEIIEPSRMSSDPLHLEYSIPFINQTCARNSQSRTAELSSEINTSYFTTKTVLIASASIVAIAGAVTMLPTLIPMMATPMLAGAPIAGDALVVATGTNYLISAAATGIALIEGLRRTFHRNQASMHRNLEMLRHQNFQFFAHLFTGAGQRGLGGGGRGGCALAPVLFYVPAGRSSRQAITAPTVPALSVTTLQSTPPSISTIIQAPSLAPASAIPAPVLARAPVPVRITRHLRPGENLRPDVTTHPDWLRRPIQVEAEWVQVEEDPSLVVEWVPVEEDGTTVRSESAEGSVAADVVWD